MSSLFSFFETGLFVGFELDKARLDANRVQRASRPSLAPPNWDFTNTLAQATLAHRFQVKCRSLCLHRMVCNNSPLRLWFSVEPYWGLGGCHVTEKVKGHTRMQHSEGVASINSILDRNASWGGQSGSPLHFPDHRTSTGHHALTPQR